MLVVIGFATGAIKVGPITGHLVKDYGNGYEITYNDLKIDKATKRLILPVKLRTLRATTPTSQCSGA